MESFSAHFNLTSMALLGMLALSAAVLVMGVTLDLATHPVMGPLCQCASVMGPVCQRACLKRDVTNVSFFSSRAGFSLQKGSKLHTDSLRSLSCSLSLSGQSSPLCNQSPTVTVSDLSKMVAKDKSYN